MAREINWRDTSTLKNLSAFQAMQVLAEIGAHFRQSTLDSLTRDERLGSIDATPEAVAFADSANALGRRLRASRDCRPSLRVSADEKREAKQLDPAAEFAENARRYHRR